MTHILLCFFIPFFQDFAEFFYVFSYLFCLKTLLQEQEVCTKLSHLAERIGLLKSNIGKFLLLRACFGTCRINHLLRSLPFEHARTLAARSSDIVRSALDDILGSPLPDICFLLACLPVRKGGPGIRDPALVLGPAFMASNFGFAGSQGELPDRFWRELSAAWAVIREKLHLDEATLAAIEAAESIDPDDIETAWTKQRWWQGQVDARMEAHFKLDAPDRLRALQALKAAHRATDISSLVGAEDGPISLASRPWTLLTRMRVGLPLDALDTRLCPGCGAAMDGYGDHVLSCHKLGIYARHNEVRNELANLCGDLNLRVEVEKGPGACLGARALIAVDVCVVHTGRLLAAARGYLGARACRRASCGGCWCGSLCSPQSFLRMCNQANSPRRWNVARPWSARLSASAAGGRFRRSLWKQSACGAVKRTVCCKSWSPSGPTTTGVARAKPQCFADRGCNWPSCAAWRGNWSGGFPLLNHSRQQRSLTTCAPSKRPTLILGYLILLRENDEATLLILLFYS